MALIGLLGVVAACELLFRALPVSTATNTGYHFDPMILTYPAHHRFTMSTGWDLRNAQTLQANNLGFAADRDFVPDSRAVALIGDSYVEASMLPAALRPGAQLQQLLGPSRPVYAMGTPGAMLLDHAERIRFASERLDVRDFVVFIAAGDVRQSLCTVSPACLDPRTLVAGEHRRPSPDLVKRWLRESAFAQYLFSQLKVSLDKLGPSLAALPGSVVPGARSASEAPARPRTERETPPEVVDLVCQRFLDAVRPHVRGRLVLVINAPGDGQVTSPQDVENRRLAELVIQAGVTVVDMAPIFRDHAARSPLSLDVGPYDHHLNGLGMSLVARAAVTALGSTAVERR